MTDEEITAELRNLDRSLFGCDGGNVKAKLWVCGIEWGDDDHTLLEYNFTCYGQDPPIPYRAADNVPERWRTSSYDLRLAQLCLRVFGRAETSQEYLENRLYNRCSDIFKLNLFPYPRTRTDAGWPPRARLLTECETLRAFRRDCRRERFPLLARLARSQEPKLLLCTGKGYRQDFLAAFGVESRNAGDLAIGHNTRVMIVPFYWSRALAEQISPLLD